VHCNDYNTMWVGVACRLLLGSRIVYDSHELWPDRNLRPEARWWLLLCEALFVRVADRVVMTSPAHAEVMARRYRVPEPVVVRNIPERTAAPELEGDGEPERLVVYVGGLQPNRGIEQAIRAVGLLEDVRLRLLGPGAPVYRATLKELVRTVGVSELVEFAEPVPPDAVVDALAGASVGLALFEPVCLSHRLVLPNKLFEYARAGVPILGSDLPTIARFVHGHGLGTTVDPADVSAIARALEEMLEPARNRALRAAAARAREALDPERELDVLRSVYRQVLGLPGHRPEPA
jgi:glycosyltransferase involved in cell wall biosynthesis